MDLVTDVSLRVMRDFSRCLSLYREKNKEIRIIDLSHKKELLSV